MDNEFATGYALGQDSNHGDDMFGGSWMWLWVILILFFFRGGFGYGQMGGVDSSSAQGIATRLDINEGFALNDLKRGIQGIQQGICDSTYALNNTITGGFHSNDLQLCNGFSGVQAGLNNLAYKMQDCCCSTQRSIDGVKYDMATQFCNVLNTSNNNAREIIQSSHNDTDRVIAALNQMEAARQQDKIEALRTENQSLKFQASQMAQNNYIAATSEAQTAELIRRIAPQAVPAYVVPNPNAGYYGYGCYNCGCC